MCDTRPRNGPNGLNGPNGPKKILQPNLLSEWRSSGADTRKGGWDILDVFPIRHLD